MSSYSSSQTTQMDQRTMAEQAEFLAGPNSKVAFPTSVIVGEGGSVGDISFVSQAAKEPQDGINSQLASILSASMATSPITPTVAPQKQAAAIDPKLLIYGGITLAAVFLLKGKI